MSMKVAMGNLFFTDEFRVKLGKELGLPGMASRNDIRRWCKTILFIASEKVLGHDAPVAEEKVEASPTENGTVIVNDPVNLLEKPRIVAPDEEEFRAMIRDPGTEL